MYGKADGKWLADLEAPTQECVWTIEPRADGTWALKTSHGFYANAKGEDLSAFTKEIPADLSGDWVVHLAMHPQ